MAVTVATILEFLLDPFGFEVIEPGSAEEEEMVAGVCEEALN